MQTPSCQHLVLPWITVALVSAAAYTRLTRTSMLEVLSEDYIRTARSKGISEARVVTRHGLRSALSPVVTQFGIDVATLLGGVIVTETVFSIDGIGRTAIVAVFRNVDLTTPIDVTLPTSTTSTVSSITPPAITTATNGAMVLCVAALDDVNNATGITGPTGYTNQTFSSAGDSDKLNSNLGFATKIVATAGTETPDSMTFTSAGNDNASAYTIALRQA